MIHELKTTDSYFQAVWEGRKNFEIRKNDRGFNSGDGLILVEYSGAENSEKWQQSGRRISCVITYVTNFAQRDNYVVMAIGRLTNHEASK